MVDKLPDYLSFLIEVDRLKRVDRQSRLIGGDRRENSAEHSWHLALFALGLVQDRSIDLLKMVKMLLIHDLVEIDAGDMPLHGAVRSQQAQLLAETTAARRIFGLLPPEPQAEYFSLWQEFEFGETAEARVARAIDRLQPLVSNLLNNGGTWNENDVDEATVLERYGRPIASVFPEIWADMRDAIGSHFRERSIGTTR